MDQQSLGAGLSALICMFAAVMELRSIEVGLCWVNCSANRQVIFFIPIWN